MTNLSNFLCDVSIFDLVVDSNMWLFWYFFKSLSENWLRFSVLYVIIGEMYVWKSLIAVFSGILNLAITFKRGLRALFPFSFSMFAACFTVPLHLKSTPR